MKYDWIPFIRELAHLLVSFESKQEDLVQVLYSLREDEGLRTTPTEDRRHITVDGISQEQPFKLAEIDPFSFLGCFNRGNSHNVRLQIAKSLKERFDLKSEPPTDLLGIPVLNNQRSFFFAFSHTRKDEDIPLLWELFKISLETEGRDSTLLANAFDRAM